MPPKEHLYRTEGRTMCGRDVFRSTLAPQLAGVTCTSCRRAAGATTHCLYQHYWAGEGRIDFLPLDVEILQEYKLQNNRWDLTWARVTELAPSTPQGVPFGVIPVTAIAPDLRRGLLDAINLPPKRYGYHVYCYRTDKNDGRPREQREPLYGFLRSLIPHQVLQLGTNVTYESWVQNGQTISTYQPPRRRRQRTGPSGVVATSKKRAKKKKAHPKKKAVPVRTVYDRILEDNFLDDQL